MIRKQESLLSRMQKETLPPLNSEIVKEANKWLVENKSKVAVGSYGSPRVSSELPDCSMPMTFDQYSYCGLGCSYCTIAGTPVATVVGNRPIEHLRVGDKLYSKDVKTGQMEITEITAVMERTVYEIYDIELENGKILSVTGEHPVWINNSEWKQVKELKLTDEVDFVQKPYMVTRNQGEAFRKNVSKRMKKSNPMKDPNIRKATLQKAVKTWIKNGKISAGEEKVLKTLRVLGENFIHEMKVPGPTREYTLDFFLPDKNIVVEYDGHSRHYTEVGQKKHLERDSWLQQEHGMVTVRIHRDETKLPTSQFSELLKERILKCA